MNIQSMVTVSELIQKSSIVLPDELTGKCVQLSNPEAIKDEEFILNYDPTGNTLELRFIEHDATYWDYWSEQDVGELFSGRNDLNRKIDQLKAAKSLYFLVATFEHGQVMHYLVDAKDEISTCGWDTGIKGLFVPSQWLIEECNNDRELIKERLSSYFEEYTSYCNGEVYTLCKDIYQISDKDYLLITDSDSCGRYIGFDYAKENLSFF